MMEKIFNIELNAPRKNGGVHQETREIVLKNFPEYNPEDVYSYDRLSCGLLIRVDENEKYILLVSTCLNWGSQETYVVYNKTTRSISVEIELCVYDKYKVRLNEGMSDILTITFSELNSNWHCSNYEFLDYTTYRSNIVAGAKPFVNNIETDEELGFSTKSYGGVFISEKIADDVEVPESELKFDRWKSHRIFFSLS